MNIDLAKTFERLEEILGVRKDFCCTEKFVEAARDLTSLKLTVSLFFTRVLNKVILGNFDIVDVILVNKRSEMWKHETSLRIRFKCLIFFGSNNSIGPQNYKQEF